MTVVMRDNGMTEAEIATLNLEFGRVTREGVERVGVSLRSVLNPTLNGVGLESAIIKIKEELYK